MRNWLKFIVCVLLGALLLLSIPLGLLDLPSPPLAVEAADAELTTPGLNCITTQFDLTASDIIPVPEFCIGGLSKLLVYTNAATGAFAPGYSWEVYYAQLPSPSKEWYGGPNISFAGVEFSDGYRINGNGAGEGVFLGGTTQDGGYFRSMDDGESENSPEFWTIESKASRSLTQASLQVCAIPGTVYTGMINSDQTIPVPEFCIGSLCMILRYADATFGAFEPGLSLPVYYKQDSSDNDWIGGPNISLGGMAFSAGMGKKAVLVLRKISSMAVQPMGVAMPGCMMTMGNPQARCGALILKAGMNWMRCFIILRQ